ncbi:Nucleotide-sugar transporter [Macleaya cordata]|uniref:Nucleotide-sugar transporter n=1 Tax=Macleaya cordata TaxID=56857 RepID=A0A200PM91_MACCD|nr:Nucleotide-sugar transporter [Macleaya cordata]
MAAIKRKGAPPTSEKVNRRVWVYLFLLTLQYGAQPLISKRCIKREVIVTSSVLACEVAKVICALFLIMKEGNLKRMYSEWTLVGSLTASGLPAAIYALQNSLLQISYKNLDSLTFSMLNQTKLFFTAFFTYLILRQKQSVQQIGALVLLIFAAVLLSIGEGSGKGSSGSDSDQILFQGIIPVLVASVLSGLASSLCQWASQVKKHSSYLMTVEMSVVGSLCLLASTYKSPDGEQIRKHGFFYGWTAVTLIPVLTNAVGGILVGLVTAHAGGVRKATLLVTAILQFIFDGRPPSMYCLLALPLVISSISVYQKYPYKGVQPLSAVHHHQSNRSSVSGTILHEEI